MRCNNCLSGVGVTAPPGTPQSMINGAPDGSIIIKNPNGTYTVQPPAMPANVQQALNDYASLMSSVSSYILNPGYVPLSQLLSAWNSLSYSDQQSVMVSVNSFAVTHPGFDPQWFLKAPSGATIQAQAQATLALPVAAPTYHTTQSVQTNQTGGVSTTGTLPGGITTNSSGAGITPMMGSGGSTIAQATNYTTYLLGGAALLALFLMMKGGR